MRLSRFIVCCLVVVLALGVMPGILKADEFKIAVLQNDRFSAQQYEPLVEHLAKVGITVSLIEAPTYQALVKMMSAGEVDAMFNGPGIPGSMMVIHQLKQQRFFASFKRDVVHAVNRIPPQNQVN